MHTLYWHQSLSFKAVAGLAAVAVWLMLGIYWIMAYQARPLVEEESRHRLEQTGNAAVAAIHAYLQRIEGLAATLAAAVERLPRTADSAHEIFPFLLDAQGSQHIAGGGLWPEPYTFDATHERRGFYWTRNEQGQLRYHKEYQQGALDYQHTPWYAPARYLPPGKCFWSNARIDLFSPRPMVTCTVATYLAGTFSGAITVNLDLAILLAKVAELQHGTQGYAFLVDRNNKLLTFPQAQTVRRAKHHELMFAHELAERQPAFHELAQGLAELRQETLAYYKSMEKSQDIAATLLNDSNEISKMEAEVIAAMAAKATPHWATHHHTHLHFWRAMANDFVLQTPATAFYFHVPDTLWTLVVVKPSQDIGAVASRITHWLMVYLSLTALVVLTGAYFLLQRRFIRPLLQTTRAVALAEHFIAESQLGRLHETRATYRGRDEIGVLARGFNKLIYQVNLEHCALDDINSTLEDKVRERTTQLEAANRKIYTLNQRLTQDNLRMSAELAIARRIQQMALPRIEEFSLVPELDIAGFSEPADEVGGDYFDVLCDDQRVLCGIGDVTDHGLESGVLMLMTQAAVRALLNHGVTDPRALLVTLNRTLYGNVRRMRQEKNLTLLLLDYQNGLLRLSGQHEEVLLVRQNGLVERLDTVDLGFMVGMIEDIEPYAQQLELRLSPGDGLVLYTDGITEAFAPDGETLYSVERLCQVVTRHWHLAARQIQDAVISDFLQHTGGQALQDDITLLIIKINQSAQTRA